MDAAALQRIADVIGHELRNPLAVINNSAYFLKVKLGEGADAKLLKHISIIESELRRTDALLGRILSYAKPFEAAPEPRPLSELLEAYFAENVLPDRIKAERDSTCKSEVLADAEGFKRALKELVDNAVEAMEQGGTLETRCSVAPGRAEIILSDSGPGISAEVRRHLFEPFFTTKTKKLGLGLALARKIIEAQGGSLEHLESKQGASFRIGLPLTG